MTSLKNNYPNLASSVEIVNIPNSNFKDNETSIAKKYIKVMDATNRSMYIPLKEDLTKKQLLDFADVLTSVTEHSAKSVCLEI